ncbi:MAG: 3-dehydroquinate synthase [Bacteroidales bacterium]|nr:3-dehydroquinate synthase [Bacteroidales bacterium]MBN2818256.1 3-dehydroquinate synthase [Bacteroidales bacterium]
MKILKVKTDTRISEILIGESIDNVQKYLNNRKTIIITDSNLIGHYKQRFPANAPIIEIGLGEKSKTIQTLETIFDKLIEYEADRSTFILAIGGGIVCDVAGFAASVFMRGMPFGFVSGTLLSQVDASVGGKNGVNFRGFKNMLGVFNQPNFVICDTQMLSTLEPREFRSGFAEIIKAGAIKNPSLFEFCEQNAKKALALNAEVLDKMVYDSVEVKAKVVEADEREKGERRLLNFGHTFAHAIEKLTGILHGEAVSIGMVLAARVSENLGMLSSDDSQRITKVLEDYMLPTRPNTDVVELFDAMKQDKKREGSEIHLVLLEDIGKAVTRKIKYTELEKIVHDLRSDFR